MLRELSLSVRPVLAFLLIVLTPLGTGQGVHRDQLLDPVFPHVHVGSGGPPSSNAAALEAAQRAFTPKTPGPAIGAGAGVTSTLFGVGLTPPVPDGAAVVPTQRSVRRLSASDLLPRAVLAEAPPDPPPTQA
jgi:hypothetical protein